MDIKMCYPTRSRCAPLFWLLLAVLALGACTPQSRLVYMQDKQDVGLEVPTRMETYRLKPGDILHVRVISPDPEAYDVFNLDRVQRYTTTRAADVGDPNMFLYGYTITDEGAITIPVIGTIKVSGKTLDEAHEAILDRAQEYLVDATVSVKIVNFSVSVLGEVRRPGSFFIYDHDFTIMDAIGLAGDLTDYGNRNILVIRHTDDGLSFNRIDITDRASVSSHLYYLQPNDVVYVEPLLAKRFGFAQFPFAVVFSAVSTTLLLINFFN